MSALCFRDQTAPCFPTLLGCVVGLRLKLGTESPHHCVSRWHHASGPYGFLFSCFVPFALDVPPLHRFQVFGVRLTDKVGCCRGTHDHVPV